jgi:esterase/lipase
MRQLLQIRLFLSLIPQSTRAVDQNTKMIDEMKKLQRSTSLYLLLLAAVVAMTIGGCLSTPERLQPSGLNSSFSFNPNLPFADYIKHYRSVIEKTRRDLDQHDRQRVIAANQPFELIPDRNSFPRSSTGRFKRGIVLIHGLSESPSHMKYLAEYFRDRGFLVRAVLLPGHGTVPGDMIEVRSEDWQAAAAYGINATRPLVDQLYLGGFSTGGTLSVLYASEHPEEISGLFLYSPCLKIKSGAVWLAGAASNFKTWLDKRPDRDFARYESFTLNSAAQIHRLTVEINETRVEKNRRLTIPTFIAMSMEDQTVDSAFTLDFFNHQLANPANQLLLFTATENPAKTDRQIISIDSRAIPEKILGFSHQSITTPADDSHYGSNGDYRNCLHYRNDSAKFKECSSGDHNWFGERNKANLSKGILQRLSWNPRFREMLAEQDRFLNGLP